jgi:major intracellular serine protease
MRVIVDKYLNVRAGAPSVNAPCPRYLLPGAELIVDGIMYKGDKVDGNDDWMRDSSDNYYWTGGLRIPPGLGPGTDGEAEITDYNASFVRIPAELRATRGRNVRVAILDSGIVSHPALKGAVTRLSGFSGNPDDVTDTSGHGTHCAGIIGARGDRLFGVAPACELLVAKVVAGNGMILSAAVVDAMSWALNEAGADVINCSFGLDDPVTPALKEKIELARKNNVTIVAAAGENLILTERYEHFLFPAMLEGCLAVGAVNNQASSGAKPFRSQLGYLMPNADLFSSVPPRPEIYRSMHGSSMATAFVTGVIALIYSNFRQSNNRKPTLPEVKNYLDTMATPFLNATDFSNPLQLFKPQ